MDITNLANLPNPDSVNLETKNIGIEGLTDQGRVRLIEQALQETPGIREWHFHPELGIASVTFDTRRIHFPEIHDALLNSGYRPSRSVQE